MKILVIIAIVVFAAYIAAYMKFFYANRRLPSSLSYTYYMYKERYNCGWVFSMMMFVVGVLLIPSWITLSEGSTFQFLAFLCPMSFIFVGAAPNFKEIGIESRIHPIAALIAAVCGIAWIILVAHLWWVLILFTVLLIGEALWNRVLKGSVTFWLEMIVILSVFTSILIY